MFLIPDGIRRLIDSLHQIRTRLFYRDAILVEIDPWDKLTFREKEVVALMYETNSNEKMADILAVSLATIKSHVDHIFKKLDVHSKREVRLLFGEWPVKEWWDAHHQH